MAATTTAAKGRKQQARKGWSPERWRRHKEKKKGKPKISEARSSAPEREAAARAQQDVGPQSTGEVERLRARVDELQAEKRQLEIRVVGLESENAELKAANAELRAKLEAAACTPAGGPRKTAAEPPGFPTQQRGHRTRKPPPRS
jgi:chromosome segregation ATPase